jgi:hypothetical protein
LHEGKCPTARQVDPELALNGSVERMKVRHGEPQQPGNAAVGDGSALLQG